MISGCDLTLDSRKPGRVPMADPDPGRRTISCAGPARLPMAM